MAGCIASKPCEQSVSRVHRKWKKKSKSFGGLPQSSGEVQSILSGEEPMSREDEAEEVIFSKMPEDNRMEVLPEEASKDYNQEKVFKEKRGRNWCLTIPTELVGYEEFCSEASSLKHLQYLCISAIHNHDCRHTAEHFHALIMFNMCLYLIQQVGTACSKPYQFVISVIVPKRRQ